jgi:hypothetical protein
VFVTAIVLLHNMNEWYASLLTSDDNLQKKSNYKKILKFKIEK